MKSKGCRAVPECEARRLVFVGPEGYGQPSHLKRGNRIKKVENQSSRLYGERMSRAFLRLFLSLSILFAASPVLHCAESYTIAVIPKGTTHEFWKSINAGAKKAE